MVLFGSGVCVCVSDSSYIIYTAILYKFSTLRSDIMCVLVLRRIVFSLAKGV